MPKSTPITIPTAEDLDRLPAGAVVAVGEDMYTKYDDVYDLWSGVDAKYTAAELIDLGEVDRIDHLPEMQSFLEQLKLMEDQEQEWREAELKEWQDFIKAETRGNGVETW